MSPPPSARPTPVASEEAAPPAGGTAISTGPAGDAPLELGPDLPPLANLLPHREPMVLLDEVLGWAPGRVACGFVVRPEARFVDHDRIETPYLLEHMAQGVAVCLGYAALRGGYGVSVGMIVSCRSFEAERDAVFVGDRLRVDARQQSANREVSIFECSVHRVPTFAVAPSDADAETIATAHMTLYYGESLQGRAGYDPVLR